MTIATANTVAVTSTLRSSTGTSSVRRFWRPLMVGRRAVSPETVSERAGTIPSGTFCISDSAMAKYASGR